MFGIDCASGDTFTDGSVALSMTSIRVPDPVMSIALTPKSTDQLPAFQRALARFQREDPTFHVANNAETGETILSGMGELHLGIYVERMKREYKVRGYMTWPLLFEPTSVLVYARVPNSLC